MCKELNKRGRTWDEKKSVYEEWLSTPNIQYRLNCIDKRKKVQKEIARVKSKYWEEVCQESGNTGVNKAWRVIKGMRIQHKDTPRMNLIAMEEWKTY